MLKCNAESQKKFSQWSNLKEADYALLVYLLICLWFPPPGLKHFQAAVNKFSTNSLFRRFLLGVLSIPARLLCRGGKSSLQNPEAIYYLGIRTWPDGFMVQSFWIMKLFLKSQKTRLNSWVSDMCWLHWFFVVIYLSKETLPWGGAAVKIPAIRNIKNGRR